MMAEIAAVVPPSLATMSATMAVGQDTAAPLGPFLAGPGFEAMTCRFGAACGSADCRPVLSLWSLNYFAALIIPTSVALLCLDRVLPVALDETAVALDARGALLGLRLRDAGAHWCGGEGRFTLLCEHHLRPFITRFAARSHLPTRLLWANAGVVCEFALRELLACAAVTAGARRETEALLSDATHPLRAFADAQGRRRTCCLRFRLPGASPCPGVCPLAPNASPRSCGHRMTETSVRV